MCLGPKLKRTRKDDGDGDGYERPYKNPRRDFSHIFTGIRSKIEVQRVYLTRRLVQDSFYQLMNISSRARLWMLRHLVFFMPYVEKYFNVNMLEFFKSLGSTMLKYLHYKNAPAEMIALWRERYPAQPPSFTTVMIIKRLADYQNVHIG